MSSKSASLGVGLLEEGRPELVALPGVHVDELAVITGEAVVHAHLHPPPVLPELEAEDTCGRTEEW